MNIKANSVMRFFALNAYDSAKFQKSWKKMFHLWILFIPHSVIFWGRGEKEVDVFCPSLRDRIGRWPLSSSPRLFEAPHSDGADDELFVVTPPSSANVLKSCRAKFYFPPSDGVWIKGLKLLPAKKTECVKKKSEGGGNTNEGEIERELKRKEVPVERSERVEKTKFGCICGITAKMRK